MLLITGLGAVVPAVGCKTNCVHDVLGTNAETTKDKVGPEIVEQLLIGYKKPEDIIGENGLLK